MFRQEIKFALYAIKKNIHNSAELRTSFLMNIVGMTINNAAFIFLWIFFVESVGVINGWRASDILALQGFTALGYGIIFSFGAGIRKLADNVASGVFDRFMLSPKNLLLRVATSSFGVSAIGDIVFSITCLIIYAVLNKASCLQIVAILFLSLVSAVIFFSLSLLINSTCFYFTDSSTVSTGLFELFLTPALFHGGAFQGVLRFIFTFIIPSLLIGTFPVEIVRDLHFMQFLIILLLSIFWLVVSLKFFNYSVRKYESSNFMTFGS
mgnify:FL=1